MGGQSQAPEDIAVCPNGYADCPVESMSTEGRRDEDVPPNPSEKGRVRTTMPGTSRRMM